MAIQQEIGNKGELLAANYLKKKGYEVLHKNYRAGKSEIDLICKDANFLVFVEVKTRSKVNFGNPESFVNDAKAAKIMEGAEAYMLENNWNDPIRFDIISILLQKETVEVQHFKDAF